jgi:hypothetical protein
MYVWRLHCLATVADICWSDLCSAISYGYWHFGRRYWVLLVLDLMISRISLIKSRMPIKSPPKHC